MNLLRLVVNPEIFCGVTLQRSRKKFKLHVFTILNTKYVVVNYQPLQKVNVVFSMEATHVMVGCSIGTVHLQGGRASMVDN